MLTVFVKVGEAEPEPYEVEDSSNMEILIACVATQHNVSPENVTIIHDKHVVPPSTVISSLDLGNILYFEAVFGKESDLFIEEMFDIKQQQQIEEQIRQEQVAHNLKYAYDNTPEAFVSFSLLWINCEINGLKVCALVDTGAQISIIPLEIAKKGNAEYLIDKRYQTVTQGIGTQKSIGRIHALNLKVGNEVWTNPFTVLNSSIDHVILGIDWMTKNRAILDLESRCMILHGNRIPFVEGHE